MGTSSIIRAVVASAGLAAAMACGGSTGTPAGPSSAPPLPFAAESANFRIYYAPGNSVQVERQEAFHAWAILRLGVVVPRKIEYRKHTSREDMGARRYRQLGLLVLPLSRIVSTSGFRGISDSTLSYRESGSFVAFLITRFGIDRVLQFFRTGTRDDALETIRARFEQAFGATLEKAEADWLAFVG